MKINEFFKDNYLVVGNTYDNWIFENCPNEFLDFVRQSLGVECGAIKPCVVSLDRDMEKRVEYTLNNCSEALQKKILARDFITAVIMRELLKYKTQEQEARALTEIQLSAFLEGDFNKVKQLHAQSFMPYDMTRMAKSLGKIELCFILDDIQNQYLQQAINIFISSREPYSVKIFTNNKNLSTYYDLNGNLIECPHDFMRRDVRNFIEKEDEEKEQQ